MMWYFVATIILSILFGGPISFGIIYRLLTRFCTSDKRLDGKTVVITGATAGIGQETAKNLALRGARIIIGCRNMNKGEKTKKMIEAAGEVGDIIIKPLDVSDLNSVKAFANNIKMTESKIDILLNNAGVGLEQRQLTLQGFEKTYATNHLGHFLLTYILLDKLRESRARIINTSSVLHHYGKISFEDLEFKNRKYNWWHSYCQSKLFNLLFTKELSNRLYSSGATANAVHPGVVSTEIWNKEGTWLQRIASFVMWMGSRTIKQGAQTLIYCAVADEVEDISGEYFYNNRLSKPEMVAKKGSLASQLWNISEKQIADYLN